MWLIWKYGNLCFKFMTKNVHGHLELEIWLFKVDEHISDEDNESEYSLNEILNETEDEKNYKIYEYRTEIPSVAQSTIENFWFQSTNIVVRLTDGANNAFPIIKKKD